MVEKLWKTYDLSWNAWWECGGRRWENVEGIVVGKSGGRVAGKLWKSCGFVLEEVAEKVRGSGGFCLETKKVVGR